MPKITIEAQLIRITRLIQPGQWLLIHPDEHYDVLEHSEAMALQGRHVRRTHRVEPVKVRQVEPKPTPKPIVSKPSKSHVLEINGRRINVEPQKLSVLQYMAEHGGITVDEAAKLIGTEKTSILSALKNFGLVTSKAIEDKRGPHIYTITNEGRVVATGKVPVATS